MAWIKGFAARAIAGLLLTASCVTAETAAPKADCLQPQTGTDPNIVAAMCLKALAASPDDAALAIATGSALERAGRSDEAMQQYLSLEAAGNLEATFRLGVLLFNQKGAGRDAKRALELMERAANAGHAGAQHGLGVAYYAGLDVPIDDHMALVWFGKASAQGVSASRYMLASMLFNGEGAAKDPIRAVELFRLAADQGNVDAMRRLATMHRTGRGLPLDQLKEYLWLRKAADLGDENALLPLSKVALEYLSPSAPSGASPEEIIPLDEFLIANKDLVVLVSQRLPRERLNEAARWLEEAMRRGVPGAALAMGNLHFRADPLNSRDPYFQSVAEAPPSEGNEFHTSAAQAAEYYRLAVVDGSIAARWNLARLFELGHGVPRDLAAARELYRQAENEVFEGPARLGLIRLAFMDTWNEIQRRLDAVGVALGEPREPPKDAIVVRPRSKLVEITVSDSVGRRYYSGHVPEMEGYQAPEDEHDLILWLDPLQKPSHHIEIEVGGRPVELPPGEGFGIRLDPEALRSGVGYQVFLPVESVGPRAVPESTRAASRIVLVGRGRNTVINVSTEDKLISFTGNLSYGERFFVPDVPGLALEVRRSGSVGDNLERLDVLVDGDRRFELIAQEGCLIHLALTPDALLKAKLAGSIPQSCDALAEGEQIVSVTATNGEVLGHIVRKPDQSIPGVPSSLTDPVFVNIYRSLNMIRVNTFGRWDELLRATRIEREIELGKAGPNSLTAIRANINLSIVEMKMGNLETGQALLDDAIARMERATYASDDDRSTLYFGVGELQLQLGHHGPAEQFLMLAHAYRQRKNLAMGRPVNDGLPRIYDELSMVSARLRRYDDAIAYKLRSLAISQDPEQYEEFSAGIAPGSVIEVVKWLKLTGRHSEADGLLGYLHTHSKREVASDASEPLVFPLDFGSRETVFGPIDRSNVLASAMANLGQVYAWMGRHKEALPLLWQKARTSGNLFGESSPQATQALAEIARTQLSGGMPGEALATARSAWKRAELYANTREAVRQETVAASLDGLTPAGLALLETLYATDRQGTATEAFRVAQQLHSSSTALAMESLGSRLNLENGEARAFLRQRQDLAEQLVALDRNLTSVVSTVGVENDLTAEATLRQSIGAAERRMAELNLNRPPEVVKLDELAKAPALDAADVGRFLDPDELLISYLVLDEASFAWTVDCEGKVDWFRLPVTGVALEKAVGSFRETLGPGAPGRGARTLVKSNQDRVGRQLTAAYDLYQILLGPLEDAFQSKHQLTIVANGVLTSVPFHALVSTDPRPLTAEPWRAASWLVRNYAVSLMPSVGSIPVVRRPEKGGQVETAYLGVGDPIIGLGAESVAGATVPVLSNLRGVTSLGGQRISDYFRGGLADVDRVRQLPRLADTAIELRGVAESVISSGPVDLLLGEEASEARLKQLPLDRFGIIHFATHGLVSGDLEGVSEPALVMTPPAIATEVDDGLLTASEIAKLNLNASWVILSACNTAGGDRPEAEALSGLARSFFFAGARSVLVSHWPVVSSAAVKLTVGTFHEMTADPELGRAEALRRSMLALIDHGEPSEADPSYWAPFMIVGDVGR